MGVRSVSIGYSLLFILREVRFLNESNLCLFCRQYLHWIVRSCSRVLKVNLVTFNVWMVSCCHISSWCLVWCCRLLSSLCFSCIFLTLLSDWGISCRRRSVLCPIGLLGGAYYKPEISCICILMWRIYICLACDFLRIGDMFRPPYILYVYDYNGCSGSVVYLLYSRLFYILSIQL